MADALLGPDGGPPDAVKDYLGRDAPVALKNPAALPVSGPPAAGVGSGPTNTAGGLAAPRQRIRQAFGSDNDLSIQDLANFAQGGTNSEASPTAGVGGMGSIVGSDPGAINSFFSFMGRAPGGPPGLGLLGELASLAAPRDLAQVTPQGLAGVVPSSRLGDQGIVGKLVGMLTGLSNAPTGFRGPGIPGLTQAELEAILAMPPDELSNAVAAAMRDVTPPGREFTEPAPGASTQNPNMPEGWFSEPGKTPQFNYNPEPRAPEDQGTGLGPAPAAPAPAPTDSGIGQGGTGEGDT